MLQVIQLGACLALGLVALGTTDEDVYEEVNEVFYTDSAVASQAAAISLGLVMAGTATVLALFMLRETRETQHEKIIRWLFVNLRVKDFLTTFYITLYLTVT